MKFQTLSSTCFSWIFNHLSEILAWLVMFFGLSTRSDGIAVAGFGILVAGYFNRVRGEIELQFRVVWKALFDEGERRKLKEYEELASGIRGLSLGNNLHRGMAAEELIAIFRKGGIEPDQQLLDMEHGDGKVFYPRYGAGIPTPEVVLKFKDGKLLWWRA